MDDKLTLETTHFDDEKRCPDRLMGIYVSLPTAAPVDGKYAGGIRSGRPETIVCMSDSKVLRQTKKRMPLMMEESGYTVGVIDTPKDQEQTDWTLIAELLRALADKIEECNA